MRILAEKPRKAAFLIDNGFSEIDFADSSSVLEKEGFFIKTIGTGSEAVRAWSAGNWGGTYAISAALPNAHHSDYDVLVVPGGRRSVEKLKLNRGVPAFIQGFVSSGRPIIVYNSAVDLLLSHNLLKGRTVSAPRRLVSYIEQADGAWTDKPSAVSGGILSLTRQESGFSVEIRAFLKKLSVLESKGQKSSAIAQGSHKAA
jgi:protease I